jgi:5-methylcytosine-specific restriction endonuclease McrA
VTHVCTLDRHLPAGVMECACGQRWIHLPREWARMLFISADLKRRLSDYRRKIEFGPYADLADAVHSEAVKARKAQETAHRRAARDWRASRERKARKYWHCVRPIVLASGPCAYCGNPEPVTVDHVIPRAHGGSGKRWNLVPACVPCNTQKSGMTPEQWKAWRLAAGLPWPPPMSAAPGG